MNYRTLGKTNVKVSEISLGTWQLGGADWGNISDDDALAILRRSAELGVNLFDTADVYGMGRSETLIGQFLKETKHTVHVATKLGRAYSVRHKGFPSRFTLDMVRDETKASLKRLGVESIFLQQWHCIPTEMMRSGEALDHLETIRKEGLVQNWGCSVETIEEARICMKHPGCVSLQVIYNLFRQKLDDELLPAAKKANVGVLARVPLASGLLSGKFKPGHRFSSTDHRSYNANGEKFNVGETFAGVPFDEGAKLARRIDAMLQPAPGTFAQKALRWILDHPEVSAVIPGATKRSQAESNAQASRMPPLSAATHRELRELYDRDVAKLIRGKY